MVAVPVGMVLCGFAFDIFGSRLTLAGISACYLAVGLLLFLTQALHELDKPHG
jgi:glucose dehydrogenase